MEKETTKHVSLSKRNMVLPLPKIVVGDVSNVLLSTAAGACLRAIEIFVICVQLSRCPVSVIALEACECNLGGLS